MGSRKGCGEGISNFDFGVFQRVFRTLRDLRRVILSGKIAVESDRSVVDDLFLFNWSFSMSVFFLIMFFEAFSVCRCLFILHVLFI